MAERTPCAVVGAAGFAGALCAYLVARHPHLELAIACARSDAGSRLDELYPRYAVTAELVEFDPDRVAAVAEAALVALPHAASAPVVAELLARGLKVVDLSADFRLELDRYRQWYGEHPHPELLAEAVYGLPEVYRDRIRGARLVAAPGCYPTAALLALWPLRDAVRSVFVDAKSGVSGAGREPTAATHFVSVAENVKPYKVEGHRHSAELEQQLGPQVAVTFVPHLVPVDQGLIATCYAELARPLDRDDVVAAYERAYGGEPFVELAATAPGTRDVRETNRCRVYATVDRHGRVVAFGAIDNLWKGAAGQAVQCLNLMLGLPEEAGLR
ncbi:MAG: N-acetyl-gamma-glutamyl-phosphate reductase [Thermoleophilum sp.]|nr:N-acetyl-gamma-glutamyl-phosphate reductase [Thermoleophilum sp.]